MFFFLSPGLILSGGKIPQKSLLSFNPVIFSIMGTQISSGSSWVNSTFIDYDIIFEINFDTALVAF
ncbi:MAG: hypothetical protein CM15mP101_13790 [Flavobacteriaceae bacterium]|nr:MAG: hypothetical protein CM15mP101_13790 [Flavobacteriaceae bacterium]